MSGGHYEVKYYSMDLRDAADSAEGLLWMASDLDECGYFAIAHETRAIVAKIKDMDRQIEEHGKRCYVVWRALDYWKSCDSSEESFRATADKFTPMQVDFDPVKDTLSMQKIAEVGIPIQGILDGTHIVIRNTPAAWDRARLALIEHTARYPAIPTPTPSGTGD